MKFTLKEEHTYWWPATVTTPHPSRPGSFENSTLELEFRAVSDEETREFMAKLGAMKPQEQAEHEHDLMIEAILNWRGVVDEGGQEIPFSETSLRQAFKYPPFRTGVYAAYQKSISGPVT